MLLAFLSCPNNLLCKYECQIGEWWWYALQDSIKVAGKEEKQLLLNKVATIKACLLLLLSLMEDGVSEPINTHIMLYPELELSLGSTLANYSIYVGVRNKFCTACVHNKKTQKKTDHICFKN